MDLSSILAGTKAAVFGFVSFAMAALCVLLGVVSIASGLGKMVAYSRGERQGQSTAGPVAINLVIGSLLVQMSFTIDMVIESLFGSAPESPNAAMSYMPSLGAANPTMTMALNIAVFWVYCIGYIAMIRALVIWNAMANDRGGGQGNGWKGFWHLVGGAFCVNITGTIRLITGS